MKMEILLEPTSNKLMVEHAEFDESDTYVLERFYTLAGNPVKEILLKLNLLDHRSILTDSKEYLKMVMEIPQSSGPTEHIADEAVHNERGDSLVRAVTTTSSLEVEQDNGNIDKTQSKATLNEPSSLGTSSGSGPRRQETIRDTIAQIRFKNVSKLSNDLLLARARVESSRDEESLGEDASKQGRINAIDADEDVTLVNDQDDADLFDMNTLTGDEVLSEQEVAAKDVNLTVDEVTLA
ncbi:hypothetical protein Tco_0858416 [Tanacetum coccineum]|uniref:Uncharacterized protein n=1 Tax=Tanacetum coccineum TaxID=301880 RepID=A0ABQ5BAW2_9ASTR